MEVLHCMHQVAASIFIDTNHTLTLKLLTAFANLPPPLLTG